MAILAALQSAAIRLIGRKPPTFFGAQGSFELELSDLVNEVAQDIAKYQDWQALSKIHTITGDGTTSDFPLPADYDRMTLMGDMQDRTNWLWGYQPYDNLNDWLYAVDRGFGPFPGGWIITGNRLKLSPTPAAANEASFPYQSRYWAQGADTNYKGAFAADTDSFVLPERLLTLGLVWRWREQKKLDASGDQEAFIKALDEYGSKDKGSRTIRRNARRTLHGTRLAWPYPLG